MNYYKIIKNNLIIDVNDVFLCYLQKHKKIVKCDLKCAQLIQSSDEKTFYTADWLCPLPKWASHEKVQAELISEEEYLQLKEQLQLDKTIAVPVLKQEDIEEGEVEELPVEELMSANEMRRKILELENIIKQLLIK